VSATKPETIFADAFDLLELHCQRCAKPSGHLSPLKTHHEMDLPADLGRATLDMYRTANAIVARLVSLKTGEVAWYDVSLIQPAAAPSQESEETT
jgi:hypothetical protein